MTAPHLSRLGVRSHRLLTFVLVAVAGVIMTPSTAHAHAHLRRSAPATGSTVSPPPAIRLWFSEAPELALTRITVLDSSGAAVATTLPELDPDGAMGVRVRIERALAPGRYTVQWATAAADGHPSSGTFTFRVARPAGASALVAVDTTDRHAATASVTSRRLQPGRAPGDVSRDADTGRPAAVVTRALWLAAIVLLLGAVAFRLLILARTDAFDERGRDAAAWQLAVGASIVCLLFLMGMVGRLVLESDLMAAQLSGSPAPLRALLMGTRWGTVWRLQFAAGVAALLGVVAARLRLRGGWAVATPAAILIAVMTALSGHAATAERLTSFSVVDDAFHVVAASSWLGGLFWVLVLATTVPRHPGDALARRLATLVSSFSPVALTSASLAALTGVVSAWLRLGAVSALWTTSYGQILLLKVALVAAAAGFGFYNWRHLRPSLGSDLATARLRRSATMELIVGGLIVLVTALLVGLPTPVPGVR